jgi:uncharacterized Zn finger protein
MQRLVRLRAETHPLDAIHYLRAFAEQKLSVGNREAYRECARWLLDLRAAHERAGREQDFTAYVRQLREANPRPPAVLDELRSARCDRKGVADSSCGTPENLCG